LANKIKQDGFFSLAQLRIVSFQSIIASGNIKFRRCAIATPPRTQCAAAELEKGKKEIGERIRIKEVYSGK